MNQKGYSLIFFLCSLFLQAQTLGSNLSKTRLSLGEVATLKIKVFDLKGKDVVSAPIGKLLPYHFDIVKDTIIKAENEYERSIQFQIFEEGKFELPALDFNIDGQIEKTIPYEIEVVNTAKQGDQLNDIMKNKELKLGLKDYWQMYKWYVLGAIAIPLILFLLYRIFRYLKKKKHSPKTKTNKTLKELELLKKKKYIESGNYRSFYVELIEITRNYLSEQYNIPAVVLLTDDLIDFMKRKNTLSQENESILEEVLQRGDLVKFAKIFPTPDVMEHDWKEIWNFVKRSYQDLELEKLLRKDV